MTKILRNRVKCLECSGIIESKHSHDFVWCPCHGIAVDGGLEYLRRIGATNNYLEMAESEEVGEKV